MKASPSSGLSPAPDSSTSADTCPPLPASATAYDAFIGIDWGDQKQFYTQRSAAQPSQKHRGSFVTSEVSTWLQQLREHFGAGRIAVAVEQSRSVLIYALMEHTDFIDIYAIPTLASANYREAFRSSGAKADNTDADALEDLLYRHRDQLRLWQPDDEQTRLLDALCRNRRHAVDERTALTNQLINQLKLCYPVAIELCREIANPMLLELLRRWPTLQKLRAVRPHVLRTFFYKHHVRREEWVQQRLDLIARATALVHDQAVLLPAELEVARLVRQLRTLLPAIEDYDRRIHELYEAHPDAFIFKSLPGAGPALEPRLLCALGSQRQRWATAQSLQNFSGLSPVRKASGKACVIIRRCACPKYLRQTFHEYAASSIKFCAWARQLYERQCASGKSHHTAIRTLAWRWVRILWRIWQDRKPYDEAVFTASQERHHPAVTPSLAPT